MGIARRFSVTHKAPLDDGARRGNRFFNQIKRRAVPCARDTGVKLRQLPHHPTTVSLNLPFAQPEIDGDILIRLARHELV
jgi:hypothetical protein